jgi:cell division transport system permease protein
MKAVERAWRGGRSEWQMHAVSALSATVAFLCLAFALLVVVNLHNLEQRWMSIGRLTAFVVDNTSEAEAMHIARALKATEGVEDVRFVSSELARSEMLENGSTELLETLPPAAFPAALEITLSAHIESTRALAIAAKLEQHPGVEAVETYAHWTQQVSKFAKAANLLAVFLSVIVFLAVVTVVSSSTKLLLERRRNEVEVLRIVGATSEYVRRPFLVEGAMQGAAGAAFAVVVSALLFVAFRAQFSEQVTVLLGMAPRFLPWFVMVGLVLVGGMLGSLASLFSLRRSFLS